MAEWFEDSTFWRELYPFMFADERLANAPAEVDALLELTGVGEGSVLDMPCGPGRHAVELASRGFRVTGVDRSDWLLERAAERAAEAEVEIEWVESDMRQFSRPSFFDLAINLFSSFGYFANKDDDLRVLRNMRESLHDGGVAVIDVVGKEWLAHHYTDTNSHDLPGGGTLFERHEIVADWTRIRNEWVLVKDDRAQTFHFELTIYSGQELADRLHAAGFSHVRLFGSLGGIPYDRYAERLVAVARVEE